MCLPVTAENVETMKKNTNLDNVPNGLYKKLDQGSQPVLILAKKLTARYVLPGMAVTQIKNGPVSGFVTVNVQAKILVQFRFGIPGNNEMLNLHF